MTEGEGTGMTETTVEIIIGAETEATTEAEIKIKLGNEIGINKAVITMIKGGATIIETKITTEIITKSLGIVQILSKIKIQSPDR